MSDKVWSGIGPNPWQVRGDGVLEPFCVYALDASGVAVGFYPFGFGLPGMLESQARALAALLNGGVSNDHEHQWEPLGFVPVDGGAGITPADKCSCGAKRYAESSGHFGEPYQT